ncbi:dissimilatory sulfite reductase (desulfoviridin) alpha/beta subunit [Desulfohalotomaculum tongense]|uniref:nitrite reductase n=1 Tax=Desulforadius tongensis TaxID=1216062 RepID=UPI00195C3519|nr:nitrite reductase [Desulforadius tongensis]MBM7855627.1 dissimilatory sulfite reductase (desulfoviridin) alpha/beta subunit [Desulforadius tongensis]
MGQGIFQQQRNGLFAVNISSPGGIFTVDQLAGLAKTAAELNVWRIKCGTRQTLIVLLEEEKIDALINSIKKLGLKVSPFGSTVRSVKSCAGGEGLCPRMLGDALELGMEIEKKYLGQPTPKDFKISTSGCSRGCTEPYCADFGVVATGKNMYSIIIGGRGSTKQPIHGSIIAKDVPKDKVFAVLDFVLNKYRQWGEEHERLCKTIERVGLKEFTPPEDMYAADGAAVDEDFAKFLLGED